MMAKDFCNQLRDIFWELSPHFRHLREQPADSRVPEQLKCLFGHRVVADGGVDANDETEKSHHRKPPLDQVALDLISDMLRPILEKPFLNRPRFSSMHQLLESLETALEFRKSSLVAAQRRVASSRGRLSSPIEMNDHTTVEDVDPLPKDTAIPSEFRAFDEALALRADYE